MKSDRLSVRQVMLPLSYSSFEDDLASCREAGYGGIAIWEAKLGQRSTDQVLQAVKASGLKVSVSSMIVNSVLPTGHQPMPDDPRLRVEAMVKSVDRLAAFSPAGVVILTGGGEHLSAETARSTAIEGIRKVANKAQEYGMTVDLEPVRYPEQTSLVSTVGDTASLLDEIGSPNVRIAFDIWHHWDSPTLHSDIATYGALFNSVHIADWREPQRGRMDRLLPGQGVIDLRRILRSLEEAGFRGWYELEVFSDDSFADSIYRMNETELLVSSRRGLLEAWQQAGLN